MEKILQELNKSIGVKGSMVITQDGIIVASVLGNGFEKETVAAIASNLILATRRNLSSMGMRDFSQFILISKYGKLIFQDVGQAFLIVVAKKAINLDATLLEIQSAVYRIKHRRP